jgi:hypothetical protein
VPYGPGAASLEKALAISRAVTTREVVNKKTRAEHSRAVENTRGIPGFPV